MPRKKTVYEVGYGRPPVATRFSSINQPRRPLQYPKPVGKRMHDLSAERISVTRPDGTRTSELISDVAAEALIIKAIKGDLAAVREVYARANAEEDIVAQAMGSLTQRQTKQLSQMLRAIISPYIRAAIALESAGLIYQTAGGIRITAKAKLAVSRRNGSG